jgi:enoyl-CoA hydratase
VEVAVKPTGHIRTDCDNSVLTITLDRPEARNAMTPQMRVELAAVLQDADRDPAVTAVIITGTDPAFSGGVDFKVIAPDYDRYRNQFAATPGRALRAMRTPVISAVNGACVSGALEIALSCAFIVASELARFADTHARPGEVATWGLTALLPRAVGVRKAREMSITGNFIDAAEALRLGLVNHVVPHDRLLPFARELAGQIASTAAVAEVLDLYARGQDLGLNAAIAAETAHVTNREFDRDSFTRLGGETAARQRPQPS